MMGVASVIAAEKLEQGLAAKVTSFVLRHVQLLFSMPCLLFLAALTAMLLRHPDVQFYEIDRIAFVLLAVGVVGRAIVIRQPVLIVSRATWPMIALTILTLASVAGQPFDHETWSLLASKLLVPFALFHIAGLVFDGESNLRYFETFALVVLGYLIFTAIAFLLDARTLIFPRFILDESLGFHADRARGPLLQAVANGVSLNMLGVLALHAFLRRKTGKAWIGVLLAALPVAILATMTRAVWLSFAGTVLVLVQVCGNSAWRRRTLVASAIMFVAGTAIVLNSDGLAAALSDRLEDRGPVDFRKAVYAGGWEMFWQHPLLGWGFHQMPAQLPRYVDGYNEKVLYPHNTYLELLVEHGMLGFGLYAWLMWEVWRLRKTRIPEGEKSGFLDGEFHRMWPVLLGVYWINASLVVMSYQFVNGLLFAMAGMLAAQGRRAEMCESC